MEVKELLEAQVPLRVEEQPDWHDVLGRAGLNGARPRMRRRRLLVPVLVAVAVLVAGVAIAAALDGIPWWESTPPPVKPHLIEDVVNSSPGTDPTNGQPLPKPDRKRARTVAREDEAALMAIPVGETGYCLIPTLLDGPSAAGAGCSYGGPADEGADTGVIIRPDIGWPARWVIYGRFLNPKAAALDLSKAAGFPFVVQLRPGGFFVANVPKDHWGDLSMQNGDASILDRSGNVVRAGCVSWGPGPDTAAVRASFKGLAGFFWHESRENCWAIPPGIDVAGATKLVELTLGGVPSYGPYGTTIALWRAPQQDGKVCIVDAGGGPRLDPPPSWAGGQIPEGSNPAGNWVCGTPDAVGHTPSPGPIAVRVDGGESRGHAWWQFKGHVDSDSGITRLELHHSSNKVAFVFSNGWFLGQLPETDSYKVFPSGGPYVVVGYDKDRNEVARADLEKAWKNREYKLIGG